MAHFYHFKGFPAGSGSLAADADLLQHNLRMLAGNGIVINGKDADFMRLQVTRLRCVLPL